MQLNVFAETPQHSLFIDGAPLQIRRLLDNLINNALKFTPEGGEIKVRLDQQGDSAVLRVCDTGIGVPEEKLEQIFERFYQVDGSSKRRYGGVGLGLALVKAIVVAHDGTISAESPISEDPKRPGTCMIIYLPLRK
jgi:signal transduction histidine kinase